MAASHFLLLLPHHLLLLLLLLLRAGEQPGQELPAGSAFGRLMACCRD
jgi:hypothetical protein